MAALESQYMIGLKSVLIDRFAPFLPRDLDRNSSEERVLSRAFCAFAISKIAAVSEKEAAESVVDGVNDNGIDAIYYSETDETLFLVQGKLKGSEQFKQEEALSFLDGVRRLIRYEFDGFNKYIISRKASIEGALEACSKIKLVVAYTGDGVSVSAEQAFKNGLAGELEYEERLDEAPLLYGPSEIKISLLEEMSYSSINDDISLRKSVGIDEPKSTYFGLIKVEDLIFLHEKYGKALYERNIRYYLGSARSDVNRAIKATLAECPDDFFYMNNGVTAVCDQVEPKGTKGGVKKFKVRGLSIINGAQTVASAAEFAKQRGSTGIRNAQVMFTLIKAPSDGLFGKRVTKARNHQNQVQEANFASLDDNQERLRKEIALLGYTYQFRPEASLVGSKVISLEEGIRALAVCQRDSRYVAWLKGEPARLSNPESAEYKNLFADTLTGLVLINSVLCYREINGLIHGYEKSAEHNHNQDKLIYRHSLYAMTSVMMKRLRQRINGKDVVDSSCIRSIISYQLDLLRQQTVNLVYDTLRGKGPLAYFRNQSEVANFVARLMEINYGLEDEEELKGLRNFSDSSEAYPKERLISYLSGKAPQL